MDTDHRSGATDLPATNRSLGSRVCYAFVVAVCGLACVLGVPVIARLIGVTPVNVGIEGTVIVSIVGLEMIGALCVGLVAGAFCRPRDALCLTFSLLAAADVFGLIANGSNSWTKWFAFCICMKLTLTAIIVFRSNAIAGGRPARRGS